MVQKELLSKEQAEVIDFEAILSFFHTKIGRKMLHAKQIHREIPFSYALQGDDMMEKPGVSEETVLIQGVIDCLIEDEEGIILIDYKTDKINERYSSITEAEPILKRRYQEQVALYGKAVEHIWKKQLSAKYLYFFDGNHLIQMD